MNKSRRILALFIPLFYSFTAAYPRHLQWSLEDCINYAYDKNLDVKQSLLDLQMAEQNFKARKHSYLPAVNIFSNYGNNLGRSINPATNQFENTRFTSVGLSANTNVLLFGWFQRRNEVKSSELLWVQARDAYEELKDNIELNITTAYLRSLLAREKIVNVKYQISISNTNKSSLERKVSLGKASNLELAQSAVQLLNDSSAYVQSVMDYDLSLIELKALLKLDISDTLTLAENKDLSLFFDQKLNPEQIANIALNTRHSIKRLNTGMEIARKNVQIAKTLGLPQISINMINGTNYSSLFYETLSNGESTVMPLNKQLNTNQFHAINLNLSIPVFSQLQNKHAVKRAKIEYERNATSLEQAEERLKQSVYTSCVDYESTLERYKISLEKLKHAKISFNAASFKLEHGGMSYMDYLKEQNNYSMIQNECNSLKYDLQFKKYLVLFFTK